MKDKLSFPVKRPLYLPDALPERVKVLAKFQVERNPVAIMDNMLIPEVVFDKIVAKEASLLINSEPITQAKVYEKYLSGDDAVLFYMIDIAVHKFDAEHYTSYPSKVAVGKGIATEKYYYLNF